jgi:hypothetical protein
MCLLILAIYAEINGYDLLGWRGIPPLNLVRSSTNQRSPAILPELTHGDGAELPLRRRHGWPPRRRRARVRISNPIAWKQGSVCRGTDERDLTGGRRFSLGFVTRSTTASTVSARTAARNSTGAPKFPPTANHAHNPCAMANLPDPQRTRGTRWVCLSLSPTCSACTATMVVRPPSPIYCNPRSQGKEAATRFLDPGGARSPSRSGGLLWPPICSGLTQGSAVIPAIPAIVHGRRGSRTPSISRPDGRVRGTRLRHYAPGHEANKAGCGWDCTSYVRSVTGRAGTTKGISLTRLAHTTVERGHTRDYDNPGPTMTATERAGARVGLAWKGFWAQRMVAQACR